MLLYTNSSLHVLGVWNKFICSYNVHFVMKHAQNHLLRLVIRTSCCVPCGFLPNEKLGLMFENVEVKSAINISILIVQLYCKIDFYEFIY